MALARMNVRRDTCGGLFVNQAGDGPCDLNAAPNCQGSLSDICSCSAITYFLAAACDLCQSGQPRTWSTYAREEQCTGIRQNALPEGEVFFASWAVVMAAETPIPSIFDPAEASSIALFIAATSTTSTLPASQTQTSSASQAASTSGRSTASGSVSPSQSSVFPPKAAVPIGGIIGAVVGICSIIALGMLLALLRRRRHQRQQHTVHELPEAATTPYPVFFPDIAAAAAAIHNDAADISDARSISKVRREYLRNELLATQEKITHIQNLERRTASTPEGGRFRRLLSARGADSGLVSELRERNEKLMSQINQLQAQMESPWARGLSDEAPPGYSEEEA